MRLYVSSNTQNETPMQAITYLMYYNPRLNIGLSSWREVYGLQPLQRLYPEVHKGRLVYRAKGSQRRVSYTRIKQGLLKKSIRIVEQLPDWLY
jgi:hypothetical protein